MRTTLVTLALALACVPASAGAETMTTVRSYAIPGGRSLEFSVPLRWQESLWHDALTGLPSLHLDDPSGEAFEVLLSWAPVGEQGQADKATLQAAVLASARAMLGLPGDADVPAQPLDGREGTGIVMTVTDPAVPDPPPEGTFRSLTQAALPLAGGVLSATILTQQSWSPALNAAIEVVRTARASDQPGDPWRQPGAGDSAPLSGLGSAFRLGDLPEGLVVKSRHPLRLVHPESGALLAVSITARSSSPREELRRLRQDADERPAGSWILRRAGIVQWSGRDAASLELIDERLGLLVQRVVAPVGDLVIEAAWEVSSRQARATEHLRQDGLAAISLIDR